MSVRAGAAAGPDRDADHQVLVQWEEEMDNKKMKNVTITSGAAVKVPTRSLSDVSYDELRSAVAEMADKLEIAGSGNGYSLYIAVFKEKKKVSPDDPASSLLE